jgi:hypothetical protein
MEAERSSNHGVPQLVCGCPTTPTRIQQLCPVCLEEWIAWKAWLEQDMRQARMVEAYGFEEQGVAA